MSNHYHIVLKLCPDQIEGLVDFNIARRWIDLFKGPIILQQSIRDGAVSPSHTENLDVIIKLFDPDWVI